ncbi:hypothetical protein DFH28DRAFT_882495, partial [Melampsora americana]
VNDCFWDIGAPTYPGEAWAVDSKTQPGIKALWDENHAGEEPQRLGRECRQ